MGRGGRIESVRSVFFNRHLLLYVLSPSLWKKKMESEKENSQTYNTVHLE